MRDEAFERLYGEHADAVFAFLVYRLGDRVAAEDLLADTFERVLRASRRFDRRKGSERTWLYSIALNLVRDRARRTSAESRAYDRAVPVATEVRPSPVEAVVERDELRRGLSALSDEEREALALRYGADLTVPEMAKLLGQPLTTVEGRVYRALRKLRGELER